MGWSEFTVGKAIHWFRRDLRISDNTALNLSARRADSVVGVFVIDPRWFPADARKMGAFQARFWLESLRELSGELAKYNIPLRIVQSSDPVEAIASLARQADANLITFNKDYEPDQLAMDRRLQRTAAKAGIETVGVKDAVIFEEFELLTGTNSPYTVFSPYKRAWLAKFQQSHASVSGKPRITHRHPMPTDAVPTAESLGYPAVTLPIAAGESGGEAMLQDFAKHRIGFYKKDRDYPAINGVSKLSSHLSAGTVSIRQCVRAAIANGGLRGCSGAEHWLSELIWREFYKMVIFHFPHTVRSAFQQRYHNLTWSNSEPLIAAWAQARTGYPIVDAAMRQLHTTGLMHNRLRMIAAMFLTKDLDTDWRVGENYFMQWLMDYDQASNVGGWQWSAGTGTDAAPYFRIMNPILQGQRYDPDGEFVKSMLPELANVPAKFIHEPWLMPLELQRQCGCLIGRDYPSPIVDHHAARDAAIKKFQV